MSLIPSREPRNWSSWSEQRILTMIALATLIVTFIWHLPAEAAFLSERTGELFLALTLAMATVYILRPVVRAFERVFGSTHKGKMWATLATFVLACLALYLTFLIGFKPVQRDVSELIRNFWPQEPAARLALIQKWQASINLALEPYRAFLPRDFSADPAYLQEQIKPVADGLGKWLTAQKKHLGFIVEILLIPVLAYYFLSEGPQIRREARLFVPVAWRAPLGAHGASPRFRAGRLRARPNAWMCVIAWVLVTTVTLLILGVPHAITLGLIAGVTRAIPVIGPLTGRDSAFGHVSVLHFQGRCKRRVFCWAFAFLMMHFLESKSVCCPKSSGTTSICTRFR